MKLQHIPNFITCLRLLLVVPVLWALLHEHYLLALILFTIAGISDALDGLLARLYGWTSRFGALADPLADKILLMSSFFVLYLLKLVPLWLMVAIVGRDIWILLGVLSYRYWIGDFKVVPSGISKINTFLQILLVPLLLLNQSLLSLPNVLIHTLMIIILITCIGSLINYTWVWGARAFAQQKINQIKNKGIQFN